MTMTITRSTCVKLALLASACVFSPRLGHDEPLVLATPLVLDLTGKGQFAFSSQTVSFDLDGDGIPEKIRWLGPGSGFLVLDIDENGQISSGRELFGDATVLVGKSRLAKHGYAALAQYDEDHDAAITPRDSIYKKLRIWEDLNQNARVDPGELRPLAYYRITSLSLKSRGHPEGYARLPAALFTSSYEVMDGEGKRRQALMGDVYFTFLQVR